MMAIDMTTAAADFAKALQHIERPGEKPTAGLGAPAQGPGFGDVLKDAIAEVNRLQHQADASIKSLASGGPTSMHDTMIALTQAENSFKLMMQVRNKIVDAYHEVLRMQV